MTRSISARVFWVSLFVALLAVQTACNGSASNPTPASTAAEAHTAPLPTAVVTPTTEPTISDRATPIASATQTPIPGPFAAFTGSEQLSAMKQRLEQTAVSYTRTLALDIGRRQSGTLEEAKAAEYLKKEFQSFGYVTTIQEFQTQLRGRGGTLIPLSSRNVVAVKPGASVSSPMLILGGHFDTVETSTGANDNGSGTAVLLAIAKELAKANLGYEIRFVAFGSEEVGLIGSREFIRSLSDENKARIQGMLNFDALAGGDTSILIGSPELVRTASIISRLAGINTRESEEPPNSTSDHFNFQREGISVLYFGGDDYSKIHTPQDTMENITPRLIGEAAVIGYLMTRQLISPQPLSNPGV